jgi:photosystem I subunit X
MTSLESWISLRSSFPWGWGTQNLKNLKICRSQVLINSILLATIPDAAPWSISTGIVMIVCNLFAIAIGRYAIQQRGKGPKLPAEGPALFEGFGIPELLATTSFGHILGAGVITGLQNSGVL